MEWFVIINYPYIKALIRLFFFWRMCIRVYEICGERKRSEWNELVFATGSRNYTREQVLKRLIIMDNR